MQFVNYYSIVVIVKPPLNVELHYDDGKNRIIIGGMG
jgi:hypothetical protein